VNKILNYKETMDYINGFTKSGKPVKDLSRIRKLLNMLNNPQDDLKFIHVAGTNGKGSTVEMISNALIFAGYSTGSFTSPFMFCYEDRIRFNGENIPQDDLCNIADVVKKSVQSDEFSQFEISMAIAFLYFKYKKCDIVVLETGIGGIVDSTNIIENTLVSVITSISFDHTDILGDTLEKIATQKAGIIKQDRPVILSADNVNLDVIKVVSKYAKSKNSKLIIPHQAELISISQYGEQFKYNNDIYKVKMIGRHQVNNAINVIEVCNLLNSMGYKISNECVKKSLESTQVSFRTQLIQDDDITIIADGSHNTDGMTALKKSLELCGLKNIVALTGMISTKDYKSCCEILGSFADTVICTDDFIYNAIDKYELSKHFTCNTMTSELSSALATAKKIAKDKNSALVVCGSLYLLSRIFK